MPYREAMGKPAAYPWRCCWDTAGLLIRRADHSEHGNRPVRLPAAGIRPAGRDRRDVLARRGGLGDLLRAGSAVRGDQPVASALKVLEMSMMTLPASASP
jgi:hypothetical protein